MTVKLDGILPISVIQSTFYIQINQLILKSKPTYELITIVQTQYNKKTHPHMELITIVQTQCNKKPRNFSTFAYIDIFMTWFQTWRPISSVNMISVISLFVGRVVSSLFRASSDGVSSTFSFTVFYFIFSFYQTKSIKYKTIIMLKLLVVPRWQACVLLHPF